MTLFTPKETAELEEAIKFDLVVLPTESDALFQLRKASKDFLRLITNKHPEYCVVPREPTGSMEITGEFVNSEWLNDNAPIGQAMYKHPAIAVYKAMIKASQEETNETKI